MFMFESSPNDRMKGASFLVEMISLCVVTPAAAVVWIVVAVAIVVIAFPGRMKPIHLTTNTTSATRTSALLSF